MTDEELQALIKDAERYRFLRKDPNRFADASMPDWYLPEEDELDEAVDAAIKKEQAK